jgi:hypothetical protein
VSTEATLTLIQWAVIIQVVVLFFWARNLSDRVDYLSTQIMELSDLIKADREPVDHN